MSGFHPNTFKLWKDRKQASGFATNSNSEFAEALLHGFMLSLIHNSPSISDRHPCTHIPDIFLFFGCKYSCTGRSIQSREQRKFLVVYIQQIGNKNLTYALHLHSPLCLEELGKAPLLRDQCSLGELTGLSSQPKSISSPVTSKELSSSPSIVLFFSHVFMSLMRRPNSRIRTSTEARNDFWLIVSL